MVMPDNQTLLGLRRMSRSVASAAVSAESAASVVPPLPAGPAGWLAVVSVESAAVQVAPALAELVAQQAAPVIPEGNAPVRCAEAHART